MSVSGRSVVILIDFDLKRSYIKRVKGGGITSSHYFHFYIMARSNDKQYRCNIVYKDGNPARTEIIEANNPPQARQFAEARFGGRCTSANQCG